MLRRCPYCKKLVTMNIKWCIHCGKEVDAISIDNVKVDKKAWDIRGIISALMTLPIYFVEYFVLVAILVLVNDLLYMDGDNVLKFFAFALALAAYPFIQVVLGIYSLKKGGRYIIKWPSIVGIVVGSVGILFAVLMGVFVATQL